MHKKLIILLTFLMVIGCGPQVHLHFINVGNEKYPPQPKDYDVQVFFDDVLPEREYKVIGMVFLEDETGLLFSYPLTDPKIINRFKKEAKQQGADAIIVVKIASDLELVPTTIVPLDINVKQMKRAEAKAIVFTNDNNAIKSNKEHLK